MTYKINNVLKKIRSESASLSLSSQKVGVSIYIFIPVFDEKIHIKETIRYYADLLDGHTHLYFISTEREKDLYGGNDTSEAIDLEIIKSSCRYVGHIHYPKSNGVKSDQINYAVDCLSTTIKYFGDSFVAIYDIDSRPNKATFNMFREKYDDNKQCNVFQQSALFLNNRQKLGVSWMEKIFLRMTALAQTRFTLAHEIPRIMRKITPKKTFLSRITYAHCVGHGLFIKVSFLKKIPLPENYYPEDMFYGYLLSCAGEKVIPLYVLDNSDMHDSFKMLFIQRSKRFLGPFFAIKYFNYFKNHYSSIYKNNRLHTYFVTIFSLYTSLERLMTTIIFLFLVFLLFSSEKYFVILSISVFLTYVYSYYVIIKNLDTLEKIGGKKIARFSIAEYIAIVIMSPLYLFFHSIPAWYTLWKMMKSD